MEYGRPFGTRWALGGIAWHGGLLFSHTVKDAGGVGCGLAVKRNEVLGECGFEAFDGVVGEDVFARLE